MGGRATWSSWFAAILCCAALTSCSDDVERLELSNATLEGTVTYKGQPVPYALVIVTNENASSTGNAASDGTYKVEHAPLGQVQIGVNTDAGRGLMMSESMAVRQGDKQPAAKFVAVPKKFHSPSQSGITTTVVDGVNQFDIKIE
jgi:hypothetical protein